MLTSLVLASMCFTPNGCSLPSVETVVAFAEAEYTYWLDGPCDVVGMTCNL